MIRLKKRPRIWLGVVPVRIGASIPRDFDVGVIVIVIGQIHWLKSSRSICVCFITWSGYGEENIYYSWWIRSNIR